MNILASMSTSQQIQDL